ncbi:hypothetical protein BGX29_004353 [Mortierella sp. GBA35]|nr:hypothetical protein BGX29_004353 [Mortierella sp. GBA35]
MAKAVRLFCLLDRQTTERAFSVKTDSTDPIGHLKQLIKEARVPQFNDVAADEFTLWKVSVPVVAANSDETVSLDKLYSLEKPQKLLPTVDISDTFGDAPLPKNTVHRATTLRS